MTENEINEVLAAELTKRSVESYRACPAGIILDNDDGSPREKLVPFTQSYDTIAMLEKLLTDDEWREYSLSLRNSAPRESRVWDESMFIEFALQMSPMERARVLAKTLGGEK